MANSADEQLSVLQLPGTRALSDFRLQRLFQELKSEIDVLTSLNARYLHVVAVTQALTEDEQYRLAALLAYGEPGVEAPDTDATATPEHSDSSSIDPQFHVFPRLGTISPWASKATDIAHNCGLRSVSRIERGVAWFLNTTNGEILSEETLALAASHLHDRMTESVFWAENEIDALFQRSQPRPFETVPVRGNGLIALQEADTRLGLALSDDEMLYLVENFTAMDRDPTDAELMMFAQANSEHCRHKIFNADWVIDGVEQESTLFNMIRASHAASPDTVLSAYSDNAAVIAGHRGTRFLPDPETGQYRRTPEDIHIQIKVETHNHPTAISPFPGAATGSGGEIRDEGATGNGSKPKAGLCGFSVSNLQLPNHMQPWESDNGKPERIVSAREIMLEGPIGAAAFNNEFGRPNLTGYFRTLEMDVNFPTGVELRGYHKPIMIAGGLGNIRPLNIHKQPVPEGSAIVVIGGPAMLIGLGGGAASSMATGTSDETLDFASVQRGNPEMQRRCQEVIDRCIALGEDSPILSMHDVGAGGLSNALPELVNDAGRGAVFDLRKIPNDEPGMSPMEIWSNEAQERYVLAIAADKLEEFEALCRRERCIYAVLGTATDNPQLTVIDPEFDNRPVDMPLDVLLGKPPKMLRDVSSREFCQDAPDTSSMLLEEAVNRMLSLPSVAAKNFLITIGDRSITGQIVRDQLVGPWQMPVADVAVTVSDYDGFCGEAMAIGERAPIALVDPVASGRIAVGEALTNLCASYFGDIGSVSLSANWMAAAGHPGEDAALFATVKAVGAELAPALGVAIPVGKDSLSMKSVWSESEQSRSVTAPLSVVVTAFASIEDVRKTSTPQLRSDCGDSELLLIDLGNARNRLGGSALLQVYNQTGNECPDVDDPAQLKQFVMAMQELHRTNLVLAYHDRSDGGVFVTVLEMAVAGNIGVSLELNSLPPNDFSTLFNEELGAVVQIRRAQFAAVMQVMENYGLQDLVHTIGQPNTDQQFRVNRGGELVYAESLQTLKVQWWQTSYQMQKLRDNPVCADEELSVIADLSDPGISPVLTFDPASSVLDAVPVLRQKPKVAVLREQGVNSHIEMAAVFTEAGFDAIDVHMSDLIEERVSLAEFQGLVACGGFSYGDVLGAGGGWAKSILFNSRAHDEFAHFFERDDVFGLGVCNGCQMFSQLKSMIRGAAHWPMFMRNRSEQFEGRVSTVEIYQSPSLFFTDMAGSRLPIAVAHGEGRATFTSDADVTSANVALAYADNHGAMTEKYPYNPNGSRFGVAGLTTDDGRFTIMMPHPERVYRTITNSYAPPEWGERGPWLRMFENARVAVG